MPRPLKSHRNPGHKAQSTWRPTEAEISAAEAEIRTNIDNWPEDTWYELSPHADLNLWTQYTDRGPVKRATIYPVIDGNSLSYLFFRLYIQEATGEHPGPAGVHITGA